VKAYKFNQTQRFVQGNINFPRCSYTNNILPLAEFSYNDTINTSIGQSPFQLVYGIHPRGILELRDLPTGAPISANGEAFVAAIKEVHDQVKNQLQQITLKYKEYADKKKRDWCRSTKNYLMQLRFHRSHRPFYVVKSLMR